MNILKEIFDTYHYYLVILILVTVSYFPTFTGSFILDDKPLIENNSYIRSGHSIASYFSQEDGITDEKDRGMFHTGYYRPLINLTYRLDYKIWGMNAAGFRTTNIVLHLLTCFMLFKLTILLTNNRLAAFFSVILFALHPVNTESVSWVASRNNILAALFTLSSFYLYLIFWKKKSNIAWIFSVIAFLAAIFSKEFGLMVLPVLFLYHRILSKKKAERLLEFTSYVPFIIGLIFYLILRKSVTGSVITPFTNSQLWMSIYFIPYLVIWNLKLIFAPSGLHYFYVSYPSSFFHWTAIIPICLFIAIVAILWTRRKSVLILLSGLSFLIFLLPVLNIIPAASTSVSLIAMRWLYLPMAFLCFGLTEIIQGAMKRYHILTRSLLIILIFYFGLYTYTLNKNFWHNERNLFNQEVLGFNNIYFAGDLAERFFQDGKHADAEKYFKVAIEKYPNEVEYYINFSALLSETGRAAVAVEYLEKVETLKMTHHKRGEWFNNMGTALFKLGEKAKAVDHFSKAVEFAPREELFWANLASIYGEMGDYDNSVKVINKALGVLPNSILLKTILAKNYINIKDYKKGIDILEAILSHETVNNNEIIELLKLARDNLDMKNLMPSSVH
ncbi:MAG: tetratricopeptide repeat protein [Deltaproteobacteria bacterium]|nr:tetratricopeptide repeat protein [Deltaproteobacteria bacterium]